MKFLFLLHGRWIKSVYDVEQMLKSEPMACHQHSCNLNQVNIELFATLNPSAWFCHRGWKVHDENGWHISTLDL